MGAVYKITNNIVFIIVLIFFGTKFLIFYLELFISRELYCKV